MTLTVRLDDALESALERYCSATGSSKSLVVQESLALYLLKNAPPAPGKAAPGAVPSAAFAAFAGAGLLGGVAAGGGADKAAVRSLVAERVRRSRS